MAKTLSLDPVTYILESEIELPDDQQTKWIIRPLTWRERSAIQDGVIVTEVQQAGPKDKGGIGVMRHLTGTQFRSAVEKGLVEIQNLQGPDGSVLKFNSTTRPGEKEKILDSLPPDYTNEIAGKILEMSGLTKREEKN